jgi:hypothetical protein
VFGRNPLSIFVTDSDIIGLAEHGMVEGDVLAHLNGAKIPTILRKQ